MYTTRSAEAVSKNNDPVDFNPFRTEGLDENLSLTIVSDAFEAITNGMHNPEAMMKLEQLESDGATGQWKLLIQAIEFFYNQDFNTMAGCLEKIPEDGLACSLKPVLYHMSGLRPLERKPTFYEEKLIKRLTEDSRFLVSAAAQLNDSIEYGGDLFIETASLLIKEIKVNNPQASERLVLWCFEICFERKFDEEPLADNILMIYGQAEGLRLIALSLMEEDPESSLICFTRALIKRVIDKSIEKEEAVAWLDIIDALMPACPESNSILVDMSELLSMLETELSIYFSIGENIKLSSDPLEKLKNMKGSIGKALERPSTAPETPADIDVNIHAAPPNVKTREAVQLELF